MNYVASVDLYPTDVDKLFINKFEHQLPLYDLHWPWTSLAVQSNIYSNGLFGRMIPLDNPCLIIRENQWGWVECLKDIYVRFYITLLSVNNCLQE